MGAPLLKRIQSHHNSINSSVQVVQAFLIGDALIKFKKVNKLASWEKTAIELKNRGVENMGKTTCNDYGSFAQLINEVGAHKFMYGCGNTSWTSVKKLSMNKVLSKALHKMKEKKSNEFQFFIQDK